MVSVKEASILSFQYSLQLWPASGAVILIRTFGAGGYGPSSTAHGTSRIFSKFVTTMSLFAARAQVP